MFTNTEHRYGNKTLPNVGEWALIYQDGIFSEGDLQAKMKIHQVFQLARVHGVQMTAMKLESGLKSPPNAGNRFTSGFLIDRVESVFFGV